MNCPMTVDPPSGDDGRVVPHDHEQLHAGDILIRGITAAHIQSNGKPRLRSSAFNLSSPDRDPHEGMSLAAKKILECGGKNPDEWARERFVAIACLPARTLRDLQMRVGWEPLKSERAHCGAWGSLSKRERKRLAEAVRWRFLEHAEPTC